MPAPCRAMISTVALAVLALTATAADRRPAPGTAGEAPVVEFPASAGYRPLVLLLSAQGGWAAPERAMATLLASRQMPVVGLDWDAYPKRAMTTDAAARELADIVERYLGEWRRQQVVLVGYREGAGTLPFLANRLPHETRRKVRAVVLLAPPAVVAVEPSIQPSRDGTVLRFTQPVADEAGKLWGLRLVCLLGERDQATAPATWQHLDWARVHALPCGADLCDDWNAVADTVVKSVL